MAKKEKTKVTSAKTSKTFDSVARRTAKANNKRASRVAAGTVRDKKSMARKDKMLRDGKRTSVIDGRPLKNYQKQRDAGRKSNQAIQMRSMPSKKVTSLKTNTSLGGLRPKPMPKPKPKKKAVVKVTMGKAKRKKK